MTHVFTIEFGVALRVEQIFRETVKDTAFKRTKPQSARIRQGFESLGLDGCACSKPGWRHLALPHLTPQKGCIFRGSPSKRKNCICLADTGRLVADRPNR